MILGIGIDVTEIGRVEEAMARHGERFERRILTDRERDYCRRHRFPAPHVAARFAAKEAALKALGTGLSGGIAWRDVEIARGRTGAPALELHGRAAEVAAALGVTRAHVSLTHGRGVAAAVVVLEGESR
ncbi:MAG: holo-ACP synthase [Acidobacteria bacterium]|nr:MAG: holo-ACP synthase [Acidobacteriota bacterium]